MTDIFYDRYGKKIFADDVTPVRKTGYFAVLTKNNKVLITYPQGSSVPEFPGGSIRRDENFRECLFRKLYEETGLDFMLDKSEKEYRHIFNYFADDEKPRGNFYIYDQIFWVYDADKYGFEETSETWKTPENSKAAWIAVSDIISGAIKINYAHWQAFKKLFDYREDNEAF